jgi:hypothetical protein
MEAVVGAVHRGFVGFFGGKWRWKNLSVVQGSLEANYGNESKQRHRRERAGMSFGIKLVTQTKKR